jgi:ParB family chromosome partitioning protein
MMAEKRKALGRGLSALIPDVPTVPEGVALAKGSGPAEQEVDLDLLQPNRDQPRTVVDDAKLEELAQSIRSHGVIQPIVVTKKMGDEAGYEIVAGERRWRAAQRAGLLRVPVVVREVTQTKRLELALIENIQRENLNPIEEATAYRRLADEYGLTQIEIAQSVGKDRATVANYQRLLNLPGEVRADVGAGLLTMGHARALAGLTDARAQRHVCREIKVQDLSVRETETLVKRIASPKAERTGGETPADVHTRAAEDRLRLALGTKVRIVRRGKSGRIEINFSSETELQRLFEHMTRG